MRHYTELSLNLLDGRTVYWEYTWHDGKDNDPCDGDTLIENVWVDEDGESVELKDLHPADQAEVMEQVEVYISKWIPE